VSDRVHAPTPHPSSVHAFGLLLAAALVLGTLALASPAPVGAADPEHREQVRFMWAMAGQESGWDYYARNASSGAFGKYQIMPFNWPAWAARYLGDARADQTPWNQEKVAYGKIGDLYRWLGSWKRVAYWWLTGSDDPREARWSAYARGYVHNIMRLRDRAPHTAGVLPARTSSRPEPGDWRRVALTQRLRQSPGGPPWRRAGTVRDGQVVRVQRVAAGARVRWIAVVTKDGRLGWLPHLRTVPAHRPERARSWHDVRVRGRHDLVTDRRSARPRPR
jgi:hypothetical protein